MERRKELLDFVRAVANADRLKIAGMLARGPARTTEITERLMLPACGVVTHLAFMEGAGVVHMKDDIFELDANGLGTLERHQLMRKRPISHNEPEKQDSGQKTLAVYLNPDGTIRQIPNSRTQSGRFRVILEYLISAFEPGASYTEKEVNAILHRFHEDVAGLRRDLVEAGLFARERDGSKYWRPQ